MAAAAVALAVSTVKSIYTTMADPAELKTLVGDAEGYNLALQVWSTRIRYMGVGAMATGGLWALLALIKPIRDGIRSSFEAVRMAKSGNAETILRTERDTPINIVIYGTLALSLPILVIFLNVVNQDELGITGGTRLCHAH